MVRASVMWSTAVTAPLALGRDGGVPEPAGFVSHRLDGRPSDPLLMEAEQIAAN